MTPTSGSTLLLLAQLPADVQAATDRLRARLAPMAMLGMPAHCTLIRHLPGPSADLLTADLRHLVRAHRAPRLRIGPPELRDRSVTLPVLSEDLHDLRATLADWWDAMLLPMERGRPRLHITLASGLNRAEAQSALAHACTSLRKAPFIDRWLTLPALCLQPHRPTGSAPLLRAAFPG